MEETPTLPPFNEFLGGRLVSRGDGEAQLELTLESHHCNRRGVAHGGVVTALLDSALGAAVISSMPDEWWCATTSLTTQFVRGGEGRLTAHGRVTRRTSRVAFAAGEVVNDAGEIVATAVGTWHLWHARPGRPTRPPAGSVAFDGGAVRVGKIVAVGRNYAAHRREMGAPAAGPPVLFLKPSTSLFHPDRPLPIPVDAGEVHHEVELAVLIGRPGRRIPVEGALSHVGGYAVGIDLTLRDVQARAKERGEPWSLAKGFDGSAPISLFVSRDKVGDGSDLAISLSVDGEMRQQSNTSHMQRSVAELIAFASERLTLERGDVLLTGTPEGVGPVRPGQRVRAEIERVGVCEVDIVAETDDDGGTGGPA